MEKSQSSPRSTWRRELGPFIAEARYMGHLLKLNKLVLVGSVIAITVMGLAVIGPYVIDPKIVGRVDLANRLKPPSQQYVFGTDENGRDIFSMILIALRLDMSATLLIVSASLAIGLLVGSIAGYIGRKVDEALMRITDVFLAFPGLILALAIAAVLGRNINNAILAITIVNWPSYARLLRGQVLAEKEKLYVEALKSLGVGRTRIILRHIIPNTIYPVIVNATLDLGGTVITFAALGFLGFGAGPFEAELGRMVAIGSGFLTIAPWLITFAGLMILISSLAFNLMGDGLRDILDPRLRR